MNKKLKTVILALSLLLALSACGKKDAPASTTTPDKPETTTAETQKPTPTPDPEPEPEPEPSEAQKLLDSVPKTEEGIISLWDLEDGRAVPTDVQYEAAVLAFYDVPLVEDKPDPESYVTKGWAELKSLRGNTMTNSISEELEAAFIRLYESDSEAVRKVIIADKLGSFLLFASDEGVDTFAVAAKEEENPGIKRDIFGGMTNADDLFEEHPALIELVLTGLASEAPLTRFTALSTLMNGKVEKETVLAHLAQEKDTNAFNSVSSLYKYGSDDVTDFLISAYKDPAHEASIYEIGTALGYSICPLLSEDTFYSEKAYRAVLEFLDPVNFTAKAPPQSLTTFAANLKERHFENLATNAPWFDKAELIAALEKADASPDINSSAQSRIAGSIENLKAN